MGLIGSTLGGGGAAAAAAAASGGGGGGADDLSSITLKYGDVTWERDGRGDKVVIGRGAFGTVYAGRLGGKPVAIKSEELGTGEEEAWKKAVRLHVRATSPRIVAVHGIIVDHYGGKVTHSSVMERLTGTLTALLLNAGSAHFEASLALRLQLLTDVAGGLAYLHSFNIIHSDVKPDNVLLSASLYAKLADFGHSVLRREGTKTRETLMGERGTLAYMDPQLFDPAASITTASDVYSFGVMAWQVLSGRLPYDAEMMATLPPSATVPQVVEALRRHVLGGGRPLVAALVERGVPPTVVALVESCWAAAQAARPTMAEVQRALEAAMQVAGMSAPLSYEWDDNNKRGTDTSVWSLALLPGGRLASGDADGTVLLWDAAARGGPATAVLEGHDGTVKGLAVLPDGRRLATGVSSYGDKVGTIVVWDTCAVPPTRCANIDCGSGVEALTVLRDGRLAAGCHDGGVRLVEVSTDGGAVIATLKAHTQGVLALALLPDGTLASGSWDSTLRLWDVGAQVCFATLEEHKDIVFALVVMANGWLASGSGDRSVRLWDVATRACVGVLKGHTHWVRALAALPDGRLVSGSTGDTIRVWDTRALGAAGAGTAAGNDAACTTPVVVLEGHTDWVRTLQLLPGNRLASGSDDRTVLLWRLPP